MNRRLRLLIRLVVAGSVAGVWLFAAIMFVPDRLGASEGTPSTRSPLLGSLENAQYRVRITAHADGPRYSVFTSQGRRLYTELTAEELRLHMPELDLELIDASANLLEDHADW